MYKSFVCSLITLILTGCAIVHKPEIEQGNIMTTAMINQLYRGMTEAQVKVVMGNPVLITIFTKNRIEYIYTDQKGRAAPMQTHLSLRFESGLLKEIQK